MQRRHSQLPIILILVTLLSVADWAVARAGSRFSVPFLSGDRTSIGRSVGTYSGDPDTPGVRGGDGKAVPTWHGITGNVRLSAAGYWIRLLQVRLLGQ